MDDYIPLLISLIGRLNQTEDLPQNYSVEVLFVPVSVPRVLTVFLLQSHGLNVV